MAVTSHWALGQYDCNEYHKFNCERSGDPKFSLNGQSRSAQVQVGIPTELNIIVYGGQDYRISLCFDTKVIGSEMGFRLVEIVRKAKKEMVEVTEQEAIVDANGQLTGETKDVKRMEERTVYADERVVVRSSRLGICRLRKRISSFTHDHFYFLDILPFNQ